MAKSPRFIFDPIAELRCQIRTNEANIGHYNRRGDHQAAQQLTSQTAILQHQLDLLEEPAKKTKPVTSGKAKAAAMSCSPAKRL